jgi:hypothetical protein
LLGFVALNPTYILPVLLRNAKPNNGRFRNRAPKVSISIKLAVFLASAAAHMKLHENKKANRRISNNEYRMSKEGIASVNLFFKQTEYIYSTFDVGRSMFEVHQFFLRSDWTLVTKGGAYRKLHLFAGFDFLLMNPAQLLF